MFSVKIPNHGLQLNLPSVSPTSSHVTSQRLSISQSLLGLVIKLWSLYDNCLLSVRGVFFVERAVCNL